MSDQILDQRKPPFYWIDNVIYEHFAPQMSTYAFAVYHALAYHANGQGVCFPSVATIAKHINASDRKVREAIQELKQLELIKVTANHDSNDGRQTSNVYTLHHMTPLHHMQTPPAPHADKEESVKKLSIQAPLMDFKEYVKAYQRWIGMPTPDLLRQLDEAVRLYPEAWVVEALELTQLRFAEGKCDRPSLAYALGICKNWKDKGYDGKNGATPARIDESVGVEAWLS